MAQTWTRALAVVLVLLAAFLVDDADARRSSSSASSDAGSVKSAAAGPARPPGGEGGECRVVADSFTAANLGPASLVPQQRVHDPELDVCVTSNKDKNHKSCCTKRMEHKFVHHAERDFYEVIKSTSSALKDTLAVNAVYYQGQFLRMIAGAENRTDQLLGDVYKIPVSDRHAPLGALFADLQAYVRRRQVNLHDTIEKFFDELFPLVYHNLLNDPSVTQLDDDYRECLTEARQQLNPRPFGDVPHRLSHTLSQALFSARTFLEALHIGVDAINTTEKIVLEPQCIKAIAKLRYCGQCDGHIGARPCRNFCYNVMRGCLATTAEIDRHWNEFVDSIKMLTNYMQGSYNIEEVLRGLHTRISEAIMHSMETGHKFYAKLIKRCGHPKASKHTSLSASIQPVVASNKTTDDTDGPSRSTLSDHHMDNFMRSIMASKGFYHNLADTLCSDEKFATGLADQDHCWNGQSLGRYNKTLVAVDLEIQMSHNPEMTVTARRNNNIVALIDRLIHVKKQLASKISRDLMQSDQKAPFKYQGGGYRPKGGYYSGDGGTQIDDEDYNNDFSGSGNGPYGQANRYGDRDGSGYGPTYEQPYRPGKSQNPNPGPGDDIYIDEPSQRPPTYKITQRPPGAQGAGSAAVPSAGLTSTSLVLVTSLLTSCMTYQGLVLWLNG